MSQIVVERAFDYFGEGATQIAAARVYSPAPDEVDWGCEYEVAWPGYQRKGRIFGIDAWQALQLAMHIVPYEILSTDDFKQGRIGIFGEPITDGDALCEMFGSKVVEGPKQ